MAKKKAKQETPAAAKWPFVLPVPLLVKLGSIAVHVDEMLSKHGHEYDRIVLQQLLIDPEVKAWIEAMNAMAMLPVKRNK